MLSIILVAEGKHRVLKQIENKDLVGGNYFAVQISGKKDVITVRWNLLNKDVKELEYPLFD